MNLKLIQKELSEYIYQLDIELEKLIDEYQISEYDMEQIDILINNLIIAQEKLS